MPPNRISGPRAAQPVAALLVAFALAGAATAHAAGGAPPAPDAAAVLDARARAFVAAVNDSTEPAWASALDSIFAAATRKEAGRDRLVAFLRRLHGEYAPLEYHHAEVAGSALHVFAKTRGAHGWRDLQFRFEEAPPYGLTQIVFIADAAEPVYLPNGDLAAPETTAWLDRYIDRLVRDEDLSGAVLLARGDDVLYRRGFGFEDAARTRPITEETRFGLGSGNKMFTALAVLRLVETGALRLDQTIAEFFPDFPDPAVAKSITIGQLLAHSSGLGDYWTSAYEKGGWRSTRVAETVPFVYAEFRENGLAFPPGTGHRYSNSGFILLGRILERVTGRDYFDLIRETLYAPLGMTRSDHYLTDGSVPDLATPWTKAEAASGEAEVPGAPRRWAEAPRGLRGTSAGGGFSTCADMFRFARALVAGRIVSPETLAAMTAPQPPIDPAQAMEYGLGLLLETHRGTVRSFGHGGIARGVNFELRYFPDQDVTLIAFCNQDNGAYDDLRKNLEKLVTGDR